MEGDDVSLEKHFVHAATLFHSVFFAKGVVEVGVKGDDFHAEGIGADGNFFSNPSEAKDADGFTHDFISDRLPPASDPLAILDGDSIGLDVLGDSKQESKGVLGDGGVIHAGSEKNGDLFLGGVVHVDLIKSDSILGDSLKTGKRLIDYGLRDGVVAAEEDVKFSREFEHFGFRKRAAGANDFPVLGI